MSNQFRWEPDVSRGEWLRPMELEPFGRIHSIVPHGFQAYARLFHPVTRDRPRDSKTWQGVDERTHFDGVQDIDALLETERASWADAATSFGTTMHPKAQFAPLVRHEYADSQSVIAPDGWRYVSPAEGQLDAASLTIAAAVLARHSTTPDGGIAAIWEGWGGLVSSAGVAYVTINTSDSQSLLGRLAVATVRGASRARVRLGFRLGLRSRQAESGSGVLTREVATGKRFNLHGDTGRRYVLFEVGATRLADGTWSERAPWVGDTSWMISPSILWPDDHAWVLATEIDFDSTLIAGTTELIETLLQTPGIEVLQIQPDADLTRDGDDLNRAK